MNITALVTTTRATAPMANATPLALAPPPPLELAPPVALPAPVAGPPAPVDVYTRGALYSGTSNASPGVLVRSANARKPSAEVKAMQQELNKWRADNNLPAITVDGVVGADTQRAVIEFQKRSGMKPVDGAYGVATRERLALENSTGFKLLSTDTQNQARQYMSSLGQNADMLQRFRALASNPGFQIHIAGLVSDGFKKLDPEMQANVFKRLERDFSRNPGEARNLTSLLESPGMAQISPAAVTKLVKAQMRHPSDDRLEQSLTRMAGSDGFKALSPKMKNHVAAQLATFAGQRDKLDNYTNAVSVLNEFTPDARRSILAAVEWRPADNELANNFVRLSGNSAFKAMDPTTQLDLVQRVGSGPNQDTVADNLVNLQTALQAENDRRAQAGQDPLPLDQRDELLSGAGGRYADNRLSSAQIANILALTFAPGMDKLDAKVRAFMLDIHSGRPDNTQLTTELVNLAGDPSFRYSRKQLGRILDVDAAVP